MHLLQRAREGRDSLHCSSSYPWTGTRDLFGTAFPHVDVKQTGSGMLGEITHEGKWWGSSLQVANRKTFEAGGPRLRAMGQQRLECTSKRLRDSRARVVAG